MATENLSEQQFVQQLSKLLSDAGGGDPKQMEDVATAAYGGQFDDAADAFDYITSTPNWKDEIQKVALDMRWQPGGETDIARHFRLPYEPSIDRIVAKDPTAKKLLEGATQEQKIAFRSFLNSLEDEFRGGLMAKSQHARKRAFSDLADFLGTGATELEDTLDKLVLEHRNDQLAPLRKLIGSLTENDKGFLNALRRRMEVKNRPSMAATLDQVLGAYTNDPQDYGYKPGEAKQRAREIERSIELQRQTEGLPSSLKRSLPEVDAAMEASHPNVWHTQQAVLRDTATVPLPSRYEFLKGNLEGSPDFAASRQGVHNKIFEDMQSLRDTATYRDPEAGAIRIGGRGRDEARIREGMQHQQFIDDIKNGVSFQEATASLNEATRLSKAGRLAARGLKAAGNLADIGFAGQLYNEGARVGYTPVGGFLAPSLRTSAADKVVEIMGKLSDLPKTGVSASVGFKSGGGGGLKFL